MINSLYSYGQTTATFVGNGSKKLLTGATKAVANPVGSVLAAGALTGFAIKAVIEFVQHKNNQLYGMQRNSRVYDISLWEVREEAKVRYNTHYSNFESNHDGIESAALFITLALVSVVFATYNCCKKREKTPKEML